jgi:shikimate kinase
MNLVLIGSRGTGKTTVATLVGNRLGWPWFDADAEIESRAGKSIARMFAEDGERAFRDLESQVITILAARERCVLALGGGAIVRAENRAAVLRQGRVIWLQASPETLWRRIQSDQATAGRRPNLTAEGGIIEIIATLDARREFYAACAHQELNTEDLTPDQVADAILAQVTLD